MDGSLQTALDSVERATVAASGPRETDAHEAVTGALRAALALRSFAATTDNLIRTFAEKTTRRDPAVPASIEDAQLRRARLETMLQRTREDARKIESLTDPLIAALFTSDHAGEASDVKQARDALIASMETMRALADEMIDVMILREAELDPEYDEPAVPLAEVVAGFAKVA